MDQSTCKICGSRHLRVLAHTARCTACGVLLFYPYPSDDAALVESGDFKSYPREKALQWYARSAFFNHTNFTHMVRFAMEDSDAARSRPCRILDFGGGGGQFALVAKSHFPLAEVWVTDIFDDALLDEWRAVNRQIPFVSFAADATRFDYIFMNDVFEHVSDPVGVLRQLAGKLNPGGRIFIDTPRQFWLYPVARYVSPWLYRKLLRGTVSEAHLQIWTRSSFEQVVRKAGLEIDRYRETSEFTMPASFYLQSIGISNWFLRLAGHAFYLNARWMAKNKILALLSRP